MGAPEGGQTVTTVTEPGLQPWDLELVIYNDSQPQSLGFLASYG